MEEEDQKYMLALSGTDNFKHVEPGDFVISLRSFEGGFEYSAFRGCVSPAYTVLRPSLPVDSGYFRYLFKSYVFRQMLASFNVGVRDGKSVRYEDFATFILPLPPLHQQALIARFLNLETARIDALIEKKSRFIELLREKRQALITQAVTRGLSPSVPMKDSGVQWLGQIPNTWGVVQLGRVCWKVADGPHFSPKYVDDGVLFLSARNIRPGGWSLDDAKFITEEDYREFCRRVVPELGDVLYTKGGTTGIAKVVDLQLRFQVWVHVAVLKLRRELVEPKFLELALNSRACYEQSQLLTQGATNNDLGLTRMIRIWLALPPISTQRQIIEEVEASVGRIDSLIEASDRSVHLLRERRAALITAAVTGQIDVHAEVPEEQLEPA